MSVEIPRAYEVPCRGDSLLSCRGSFTRSACARSAFSWTTPAHSDQGWFGYRVGGAFGTLNGGSQ